MCEREVEHEVLGLEAAPRRTQARGPGRPNSTQAGKRQGERGGQGGIQGVSGREPKGMDEGTGLHVGERERS